MSYFFKTWHREITAELAAREPMNQRLFAESEDECKAIAATPKPSILRSKGNRSARLGSQKSSAPYLNTSDSASFLRSLKKSPIKY
jgi:hypothetical protein